MCFSCAITLALINLGNLTFYLKHFFTHHSLKFIILHYQTILDPVYRRSVCTINKEYTGYSISKEKNLMKKINQKPLFISYLCKCYTGCRYRKMSVSPHRLLRRTSNGWRTISRERSTSSLSSPACTVWSNSWPVQTVRKGI